MKKQLNLELKDSGPCHSSITKCLGDVYVSLLPKSQFSSTVRRECWTEACVSCLLNVKVHILKQNFDDCLRQSPHLKEATPLFRKQITFLGTPFWVLSLETKELKLLNSQVHFTVTP